jgi:hypothetical protein
MKSHQRINDQLSKTKNVLYSDNSVSNVEQAMIGESVPYVEVLTPVYKNIEKNDMLIAEGILDRISPNLNTGYQLYLEQTKSNNTIVNKLGEQLQRVVLKDVNPLVDLDYDLERTATFDIQELRNSREFKNAINRSIYYRQVHVNFSQTQIDQASDLLALINEMDGITN